MSPLLFASCIKLQSIDVECKLFCIWLTMWWLLAFELGVSSWQWHLRAIPQFFSLRCGYFVVTLLNWSPISSMVYDKACSHQRTPKMHVLGWEYTMCLESRHRPKINREHNWDSLCNHLEIERIFTRDCYDLCRFSTSIPKLETTTFVIRKH